jgi:hypothetical protein
MKYYYQATHNRAIETIQRANLQIQQHKSV